ncbi:MAG: N-6 DNA methylase [Acidimicrobiia bacterium]|nr:N-6 DNA methylase [Acidimicrobiia bacterium]
MPTALQDRIEALKSIRTFAQVSVYLRDELGWPLEGADLEDDDLQDSTYNWDPDELGISADKLPDLTRLQQMRPLTADQPWGVFLVEFGGPRLPITQLRRLLQALVARKRRGVAGTLPSWSLDDLLFIVFTGRGPTVEMHFIAFFDDGNRLPKVRSLAWRPIQSPHPFLSRLAEELLPALQWPDDSSNPDAWKARWREAFKLLPGQAISDAARLADRMARTAIDLRDQIGQALRQEKGEGPFTTLMDEVREQLVSDVDVPRFADMCAQTLVYGTLTSRITDPEGFGSSPIFSAVPLANPFLAAFFEQVHDEAAALDMAGSGIEQFVADLRVTDVESILDQFGSTAKGGDPVIHFYEEFLKKYDSKMRADAGAFYTPQPVVDFIVRATDEVLRSRFGLSMGIADPATWQQVADRNQFEVPEGVDPDRSFVSMVDPATGTGTFLVAWLRQARRSFLASGGTSDDWSSHLREHVLSQMHAFELMLGPYAIAHLKVALELHSEGVNDGDPKVLLTDTLDHTPRQGQLQTMSNPVAQEGERAAELKEFERFTVVLGNPPYDREEREVGAVGKRKGGVVRHGVPGIDPLLNTVTQPMRNAGLGVHLKNVYNDYVYFWCWAAWQATRLPSGPGVVAFITASSYLDGISMGGVRHMMRQAFDELRIIDLGGEGRGAHAEENVFDIRTPVAIAIGFCSGQGRSGDCTVLYHRVEGSREQKLAALNVLSLNDVTAQNTGTGLDDLTPRSDAAYYDWPQVTDLFPWIRSGCKLGRTWPIAETKGVLERRWQDLVAAVPRQRQGLFDESPSGQKVDSEPMPLLAGSGRLPAILLLDREDRFESVELYGYRSFDRQWLIADQRLIDRAGSDMWQARGPRQVFLTTLTSTKLGRGPALTVSPYVPDLHHFRGSYGAKNVMPLYRDSSGQAPNVTDGLLVALGQQLGTVVTAEDLLAYVYALGGTSAFSERLADELAEGAGPVHLPITTEVDLFHQAVELGRDLLWHHTWGERFAPTGQPQLPVSPAQVVAPVEAMPEQFAFDPDSQTLTVGTGIFGPVTPEVWEFEVSGLKVLRSWLGYRMKNRKGKKSSPLDDIRPTRWTQTDELLRLLAILEHTIEVTPTAATLLDEILANTLIPATDLPKPTSDQRKPLKSQ